MHDRPIRRVMTYLLTLYYRDDVSFFPVLGYAPVDALKYGILSYDDPEYYQLMDKLASREETTNQKVAQVKKYTEYAHNLEKDNKIKGSILVGDFNAPSHLDWAGGIGSDYYLTDTKKKCTDGSDYIQRFPKNCFYIEYPVTKVLEDGGFSDSFREFWPNVKENPGNTWPSYATNIIGGPIDNVGIFYIEL